ncbi:MAG: hypothetical protein E6J91_48060, partial [Deltaproteobacteria bacterium]
MLIAGAISGALPLLISYSSSSFHTVNGVVVEAHYRDWIAVGGGGMAAALALIAMVVALRATAWAIAGISAAVLLLGGYQMARGFGAFSSAAGPGTRIADAATRESAPTAVVRDPASCADQDACDKLAADLAKTDPKGALAAYARGCDLGEKSSCIT